MISRRIIRFTNFMSFKYAAQVFGLEPYCGSPVRQSTELDQIVFQRRVCQSPIAGLSFGMCK